MHCYCFKLLILVTSLVVLAFVQAINRIISVQGSQVNYLIGTNNVPTSEFTYWVPPPPAPFPPGEEPPSSPGPPSMIKVPFQVALQATGKA